MSQAGTLAQPVRLPAAGSSRHDRRRRFWFVVWVSAVATYKRRFAGTVLGYVWAILQPLLLFAVIYTIFTEVIRFGNDIENYSTMLLANIVFFFWFRRSTITAMRSFVARKAIVGNVRVPPLTMPLAAILASTFVFLINLVVSLGMAIAFGTPMQLGWLLIPVLVVYLGLVNVVIGILLACTYVRVRDVAQVWQPIVRLMFYVSGAIFLFALIPDGFFRTVAAVNPLSPLFVEVRVWLVDANAPNWPESAGSALAALLPFVTLTILGVLAVVTYRATRTRIAEGL